MKIKSPFNKTKVKPKYAEGGTFDPDMLSSISGLFSNTGETNFKDNKATGELIGSGLGALSTFAGIPAPIGMSVGKTIGGLIGGNINKEKPVIPAKANSNPFGNIQFKNGGDLKQYNAPTHEQGGQMIDANMNPTNNQNLAVGEIEKNENGFNNYIYSDTLGNGKKTFADLAKKIVNKYENKKDEISTKTKNMELERLKQQNEAVKQQNDIQNQPKQFGGGGDLVEADPIDLDIQSTKEIGDKYGKMFKDTTNPKGIGYDNLSMLDNMDLIGVPDLLNSKKPTSITGGLPSGQQVLNNSANTKLQPIGSGDTKPNNNLKNLGLAGLGLSFGLKAADALGNNVEQEKLQLNPEANQIKDLMGNRSINFQSILNQIDTSKNAALANNNSARSVNVKRALDTNVFSNAMQQMANSKLQEQQANNQYRGEEAGVLNNLGQQESAERIRQQNIQSMNSANLRNMRRDLIGDVNKMSMEALNLDNYDKALKNKQDINRLTIEQYKSLAPSLLKYYDVAENPDGTIKLTLKK